MIITNFDSFNEGFLGVDIKKIKEEAQIFSKTKECVKILSKVDTDILDSVVEELRKLKQKWGSIDALCQKLLTKAETSNEGITGVVILSIFGIHAFMKLLLALKNNYGFLEYLDRLFWSEMTLGRTLRDVVIMVTFIIYVIVYLIANQSFQVDYHKTSTGVYTELYFKWNGIHDYVYKDGVSKQYDVKRLSSSNYGIFYKGKKIGTTDLDNIYRLDGKSIMVDTIFNSRDNVPDMISIDLEKILTGKYNKSTEVEIETRKKEIDKLKHEIDSLNTKAYENVDMAKKIFKDAGKNYDEIISGRFSSDRIFVTIKDILTQGNNIGYLGLFANIIVNDKVSLSNLEDLYNLIKKNKDIINNLRDNNGNLCSLFDFKMYETAFDALERLSDWRKVNQFIRKIPSVQKRLIWKDGYYTDGLKSSSQFLTSAIVKISDDDNLSRTFLSKISAAKTSDMIVDSIARITNQQPWDFNYWLNKLNSTRNVYVTWHSKEKNQIVCIVTTHSSIKKIAYMTNWCIVTSSNYFKNYSKDGFQCILYDFNYPITSNNSVIGFSLNDWKNRYKITSCHNKSDDNTQLPDEFLNSGTMVPFNLSDLRTLGLPGHGTLTRIRLGEVKPEFVQVNLTKAALKFDNTFLTALRERIKPVRKFLNKPGIAKFINFYDSDY